MAVRQAGHRRGRLADRRPGARRRRPGPPVRPGQLGSQGSGPAAVRPGHLARPGRLTPSGAMRAVDPRLLRHARAARGYLIVAVLLGLAVTGLILAQAALLAHALAAAALGTGAGGPGRDPGAAAGRGGGPRRRGLRRGGRGAAGRRGGQVQLRRELTGHSLRLGPAWLGGQQPGQIAALATRGLDGLDPYFARYLPQLVLSVLVPAAVVVDGDRRRLDLRR